MRCYTITRAGAREGIAVLDDPALGRVVALGEAGRGRLLTKVKLDGRRPPSVVDGLVHRAAVAAFEAPAGVRRHCLVAPKDEGDPRVLLRVSTSGCYTRNTLGRVTVVAGEATIVTRGHGAEGAAGRLGDWEDVLVIAAPGSAIKVKPYGGYKTPPYVAVVGGDGTVSVLPYEDWQASQGAPELTEL